MLDIMAGGKCIENDIDPGELTRKYQVPARFVSGILDKFADGAEGVDVPGVGVAVLSAVFLSKLWHDSVLEDAAHDLTCREIAAATGRTVNGVTQILDRAKRKMQDAGTLRDFLRLSLELKRLRRGDRSYDDCYDITVETRVTVEN